jgi:hypothetical protein
MHPVELPTLEKIYYFADGSFFVFEEHHSLVNGKDVVYGKTLIRRDS